MIGPKRIRLAGRWFKVRFQTPKNLGKNGSSAGSIICDLQKIWVDATNVKGRQKEVLLHEIIHAVDFFGSLHLTEDQVHGLANGLYAALKDNPKVVHWLFR